MSHFIQSLTYLPNYLQSDVVKGVTKDGEFMFDLYLNMPNELVEEFQSMFEIILRNHNQWPRKAGKESAHEYVSFHFCDYWRTPLPVSLSALISSECG